MSKSTKSAIAIVATARKSNFFSLTPKTDVKDLGDGQRGTIAQLLKKTGGATRATIIAALPEISAANISWYLSTMIGAGQARKTEVKPTVKAAKKVVKAAKKVKAVVEAVAA